MENETTVTEVPTTWCVYHLIHVRTPHQHIPKLLITEVPQCMTPTFDTIERAGYLFDEFNISWANHVLEKVSTKDSPSDLVSRIRQGDTRRITWGDLIALAEEPI